MYTKGMPMFSCVARVFHRLPSVNVHGKSKGNLFLFGGRDRTVFNNKGSNATLSVTNVSDFTLKRCFSVCNSSSHIVDYRISFYNNRCHSLTLNLEFLKSHTRTGRMRSSFVSSARRMFMTAPQPKMTGLSFAHILIPRNDVFLGCCFYSTTTTVTDEGHEKPANVLHLEMVAKKIIDAAKKRDVMAGSVPLKKIVALLKVLHHQGFDLDGVSNILGQQLPFLLDLESLTNLTELLLSHGFRHNTITLFLKNLPLLEKNTSLKHLKNLVDDSISFLRIAGFKESDICTFLTMEPRIFFTNIELLNSVISQLKGLFSAADSLSVIASSPNIFIDPWVETRKKFNYVYFVMGYKQQAMLKSLLFQHSPSFIEDRHKFLLRAGFFHFVKEKDDPKLNPNPPLNDVLDTPDLVFARKFGGFGPEEYTAYLNMRDVEREEEDDDINNTSDDEDVSEEEEDNIHNKTKDRPLKRK